MPSAVVPSERQIRHKYFDEPHGQIPQSTNRWPGHSLFRLSLRLVARLLNNPLLLVAWMMVPGVTSLYYTNSRKTGSTQVVSKQKNNAQATTLCGVIGANHMVRALPVFDYCDSAVANLG